MKLNTVLVLLSGVLMTGCAGGEETTAEATEVVGEASQGLCSSNCQCQPGYKCSAGSCVWASDFGPPAPNPCTADCHCKGVPGTYCSAQEGSGAGGNCTKPQIIIINDRGFPACGSNGNVAHPSPGAFIRVNITGKPGASVVKYNRHASCGPAAIWWKDTGISGSVIPASGALTFSYPTSAPMACDTPNLGGWENYVVVGGLTSDVTRFAFYNSSCGGGLATCTAAYSYCPPTGACNGLGCP